jgi:hypothetical protein
MRGTGRGDSRAANSSRVMGFHFEQSAANPKHIPPATESMNQLSRENTCIQGQITAPSVTPSMHSPHLCWSESFRVQVRLPPNDPIDKSPVSPPTLLQRHHQWSTKPAIGSGPNDGIGSGPSTSAQGPSTAQEVLRISSTGVSDAPSETKTGLLLWYRQSRHWDTVID